MKIRHFILLSIFISIIGCSNNEGKSREVKVIGTGKMKIVPDMVELTIKAQNTKPAMKDAVKATRAAVDEVLEVCSNYILESTDIRTSSISSNKDYVWRNNENKFLGYQASQTIDVTLRDISEIESFTEELLATKISSINNLVYMHSKADSIMREVDLLALEDATNTARQMCEKMHEKSGKVLSMANFSSVSGANNYGHDAMFELGLFRKGFGGQGFRINPDILEFVSSVYVTFEIE